jgi:hypothetical protein
LTQIHQFLKKLVEEYGLTTKLTHLMLKKMDGILNDYAGNGGGTATFGGETEKK